VSRSVDIDRYRPTYATFLVMTSEEQIGGH